jgi:hypothetical protein
MFKIQKAPDKIFSEWADVVPDSAEYNLFGSGSVWWGETPGEPQRRPIFWFPAREYARPTGFCSN